ncbi:hypothetical protein B0H13DRAFT_2009391 [Mycena leptocephala]|nr:hypothetical protein B0H13DRAFT_2009391 [Mycena leptocephala]
MALYLLSRCSSPSSAVSPCTRELIHSVSLRAPSNKLCLHRARVGWASLSWRGITRSAYGAPPRLPEHPISSATAHLCVFSGSHFSLFLGLTDSDMRSDTGSAETAGMYRRTGWRKGLSSIDPLRSDPTVIVSKSTLLFQTQEWSAGKSARPVDSESGWMAGSQRPWNSSSRRPNVNAGE